MLKKASLPLALIVASAFFLGMSPLTAQAGQMQVPQYKPGDGFNKCLQMPVPGMIAHYTVERWCKKIMRALDLAGHGHTQTLYLTCLDNLAPCPKTVSYCTNDFAQCVNNCAGDACLKKCGQTYGKDCVNRVTRGY